MRKTLNPFLYGRPVPIERHIDREMELRKIFSRIKNKESTAIVGNPQIGKTSLIQYLLSEKVMKMWLNDLYEDYIFPIQIDVYAGWLSSKKPPLDIWRFIFGTLKNKLSNEDLISSLSKLDQRGHLNRKLRFESRNVPMTATFCGKLPKDHR